MARTNYLNNKDILKEIHKSKSSYCFFTKPEYHAYDMIIHDSIKKMNKTKIQGGVLIKYPKKKQDLRVDLPTIGLDTLKDCKKAGLRGIVLKNKKNIFLEKNKCVNFANKNKMFISVK